MNKPEEHDHSSANTVHYRSSTWRIFRAQLWAEFRPRAQLLLVYILLQALCIYIAYIDHAEPIRPKMYAPGFSLLELMAWFSALTGVFHSIFYHGMQGDTCPPPWHRMALPVRHHLLILPGVIFQFTVALIFALLWATSRSLLGTDGLLWATSHYLQDTDFPVNLPLMLLLPLAAQGQAAVYWHAAAGKLRGSVLFLLALASGVLMAHQFGTLNLLRPPHAYALFITLCGTLSTLIAACILRSGTEPMTSISVITKSSRTFSSLWSRISARCLPAFRSPFWAQVWFEWRSTAMWLPILLGGGLLLVWSLANDSDTTSGLGFNLLLVPILIGIPAAIAYVYNRVSPQYRSFVLICPISSQRAGRAKATAMALALLLVACFSEMPRLVSDAFQGYTPGVADFVENSSLIVMYIFFAVYGILGIAVNILQGFVQFPFELLRFAVAGLFDPVTSTTATEISEMNTPIPGAGALATIVTVWMLLRAIGRRFDTKIQMGRELWFPIVSLILPIAIAIIPFAESIQSRATLWYIWGTPFVTFGALFEYGLRTRLISRNDVAVGLALFLILYAIAGYAFAFPTEFSAYFINMHFGHWCVLLVCPILWYPLLISIQRYGKLE